MSFFDVHDLKKIENLELLAKKVVEGFIIGLHKSPFHGFSVEFAEHRLYNPGEGTKNLDWKVYARILKSHFYDHFLKGLLGGPYNLGLQVMKENWPKLRRQ